VPLSKGGNVNSVDVGAMMLITDFDRYRGMSSTSSHRRRPDGSRRLPV
jgi:hypothetical protein